ncbi:hypothetical protein V6N13_117900 [Hibiscus sabdariffa]
MATVCCSNSVEERLHGWGLGEINVKSMGGCWFLIEFKDQELFEFLKEQDWSYLKEVFSEVEPWTESFHLPERITWIQAEGIPLHCWKSWNHTTFKRLAESWGSLLALGENASQLLDGDKMTLLVSTSQRSSIDELKDENRNPCNRDPDLKNRECSPGSSSDNVRVSSPASMDISKSLVEDEAINVLCMGNSLKETIYDSRHVGEACISGCRTSINQDVLETIQKVIPEVEIDGVENGTENSIDLEGNAIMNGPTWAATANGHEEALSVGESLIQTRMWIRVLEEPERIYFAWGFKTLS